MKIKLIAYGIAKDIISVKEKILVVSDDATIETVKTRLLSDYPAFSNLRKLSFAVGVEYREDSFQLNNGDEVVIIPPVSGG